MRRADSTRRRAAVALTLILLTSCLLPKDAASVGSGQWTPAQPWGGDNTNNRYAVHMMLMAGDGLPYHSRILWYGGLGGGSNLRGGEWGWTPGGDGCSNYPNANFTLLAPGDPGIDIFCGGHTLLGDGRALLAGGTEHHSGSYGVRSARLFTPGTSSAAGGWSSPPPGEMSERRWYPTMTTLRDGRVLALAGSQYLQHRVFGGRIGGAAPSSPNADQVYRNVPIMGEAWDPSVLPAPDPNSVPGRPDPRESLTGVEMTEIPNFGGQVFFGGRRGNDGRVLGDTWMLKRTENMYGDDYAYEWKNLSPVNVSPSPLVPRSDHTAVVATAYNEMIVYGGRDSLGQPVDRVWRLYWSTGNGRYEWDLVTLSGDPPSNRYGHVAFFESRPLQVGDQFPTVNRMIVYGGAGTGSATPADNKVYELRFSSPSSATWSEMPDTALGGVSALPAPRKGHAVGWSSAQRYRTNDSPPSHSAYVFGGELAGGVYSDTLWTLWTFRTGKYAWEPRATSVNQNAPGPRARFSMITDNLQGGHAGDSGPRLHIFGGENASGLADRDVHVIDPWTWGTPQPPSPWGRWEAGPYAVAGHVAVLESRDVHARVAEVFDPVQGAGGSWTSLPASQLLQPFYPLVFTISGGTSAGGRILTASAASGVAQYLDLPGSGGNSSAWQALPNGSVGFAPLSGVMYRPNKLMVAGGQSFSGTVVGTTKTLDASNLSNSWGSSASMIPRYYHNLVALPDGKVLVVGGNGTTSKYNDAPVYQPQIWDPAGNGGAGTWTSNGTLASSTQMRGYHSTALLLPDGRVLVSGGENVNDKYGADIFCPPYLFNANGSLANRPVLTQWPRRIAYGERFAVCVDTDTAQVASMALIRSAAVTHGFDENQRFVPLTIVAAETATDGRQRFSCTVPSDSSIVPPGDYMLFVVNAVGTPGLAQWVRIGATNGDTDRPRYVENLEIVAGSWQESDSSVLVRWPAPPEDSLTASGCAAGPAARYEMHYRKILPMATWSQFAAAPLAPDLPAPGEPEGAQDTYRLRGLENGFNYYVRLVAKDFSSGSGNWSAMSGEALVITPSSGGGEGGGDPGEQLPHLVSGGGFAALAAVSEPEGPSFLSNTLFPHAEPGVSRTDRILLPHGPRWEGELARVRIARWGGGAMRLAHVRLIALDHADDEVFVDEQTAIRGTRAPAAWVRDADGRDWSESLANGTPYESQVGDVLDVSLGLAEEGYLFVRVSGAQVQSGRPATGIDVQAEGAQGWLTIGHVEGRTLESDGLVALPAVSTLRLVFRGNHRLHAVGRVAGATTIEPVVYAPAGFVQGETGTTTTELTPAAAVVASGEELFADFEAAAATSSGQRAWLLEVEAEELPPGGASLLAQQSASEEQGPTSKASAFGFAPLHPNPTAGSLQARFSLPIAATVRLDVFDLLGRRVVKLADARFDAGEHVVVWDGRSSAGARAAAGVYVVRLTAGELRAQRMFVMRP